MDKYRGDKEIEDLFYFLSLLKQYLPKNIKKGDKSGFDIEIRSCQHIPANIKIETFSFDQRSFNNCFDYKNKLINNAVLLITVFFKIKDLKELNYVQAVSDAIIRKLLKFIPKEIKDNFKFFFRYKGNNIFIDFYLLNEPIVKAFLDTGINLTEYDNFYINLNSSFIVDKLLSIYELKELYYDIFTFVFYIKTSRANIDYLFECFQNVLKNHKFNNQKKVEEIINGLMSLYNLSSALTKFKLELDSKKIINEYLRIMELYEKEEIEEKFEELFYLKNKLKEIGKEISKGLLSKGLLRFSQVIILEEFAFFLGFPRYKNGITLKFYVQGLTKFVSIFYIYIFLFIILEKSIFLKVYFIR